MRVKEQLVQLRRGNWLFRIWLKPDGWRETFATIEALIGDDPPETINELADKIADLPNVSAVQITDDLGFGPCVYPSWP